MGIAPLEPVAGSNAAAPLDETLTPPALDPALFENLWRASNSSAWGLDRAEFDRILIAAGAARNTAPTSAILQDQKEIFGGLRVDDLVLAQACAAGSERAWRHFLAIYREPLTRAAIAIAGNESTGRDLADQLYAELYGLSERDGVRRCPLASYRGRGSLLGWLRTTLAQRHVDRYRSTRREQPLDQIDPPAPEPAAETPALVPLARALQAAIAARNPEDRYLLAAYYLDGSTLLYIARVLGIHEATVSRKLHRVLTETRKHVLRHLEQQGLSRRAAGEALGADPRDLDINLKKLLQQAQNQPFPEKAR